MFGMWDFEVGAFEPLDPLIIIGGGLAGSEAAWQAARQGVPVILYEMRPRRMTEAHRTGMLAELVCSNSLRSLEPDTGAGLLKQELERAGSLIIEAARASRVQAGSALAVDRALFSQHISEIIEGHPLIEVRREETLSLPEGPLAILASGPLTSPPLAEALRGLIGDEHLYFYDAIAPILEADSIDASKVYSSSRYGKGGDDYLNCPMEREDYERFYDELILADSVAARSFENMKVFEGCMPVEIMARRGRDTLRFGPMRPVGLKDPKTGRIPYAVVQLRSENRQKTAYNMVGFQTRLTWTEQRRVFGIIPGLAGAEFLRFGSVHRNTFINGPRHLTPDLALRERDTLYLAGQITGVEGYIESTAMGLIAGVNAARRLLGKGVIVPPPSTAHGALINHITASDPGHFQPSNIHFGLIQAGETLLGIRDKRLRRQRIAEDALVQWEMYVAKAFD